MKCKECGTGLKSVYYDIGGKEFCKHCALIFMSDIADFKVYLNQTGGK